MKIVISIVVLVLLAIGGFVVFVVMNSGSLIKQAVETYGPQYLGADVSVSSVELSLADGTGEIRGLTIGNPAGFDGPHAFHIQRAAIAVDVESLGSDVVVIKSVVLDGAQPAVVVKGLKDTNFQALVDNLERSAGSSAEASPEQGGAEPKLIVDSFAFTNAVASVDSQMLQDGASVEIPDIHLQDIGRKENGVVAAEAVKQMLRPISRKITEAVVSEQTGLGDIEAIKEIEDIKENPLKLLDKLRSKD